MAGPCSAESEQQVLDLARGLSQRGVHLFRAGLWKPRTRPGTFEGVGKMGLQWMINARAETGMRITTEVANVRHLDAVLEAGFDAIWIGARTTASPFAVQEIAEALKGVEIPVIIKNPVNPDAALWGGAVERIAGAGIKDITLIHRGFSFFNSKRYRNEPAWQIPIEVRTEYPELPMLCDISHIAGARPLLTEVAQAAMDLDYHGLMIEVHSDPDKALSDAGQQVDLETYDRIVNGLVIRDGSKDQLAIPHELLVLRNRIDSLDGELVNILGERMQIGEEIGELKDLYNLAILQPERWAQVLKIARSNAAKHGLTDEFVEAVFRAVHQESIDKQMKVMRAKGEIAEDI